MRYYTMDLHHREEEMITKTWTATDLTLGKLTINRGMSREILEEPSVPVLRVERRYKFLDTNGDVLTQIAGRSVLLEINIDDISADILTALQTIDAWTKAQALEQEEMI